MAILPESTKYYVHETEGYSRIVGKGIGPDFPGHFTENEDRVVGFVLGKIEGRYPSIDNLAECQKALSKLHDVGILHRAPHSHNIIIKEAGKAELIDFKQAELVEHDIDDEEDGNDEFQESRDRLEAGNEGVNIDEVEMENLEDFIQSKHLDE